MADKLKDEWQEVTELRYGVCGPGANVFFNAATKAYKLNIFSYDRKKSEERVFTAEKPCDPEKGVDGIDPKDGLRMFDFIKEFDVKP